MKLKLRKIHFYDVPSSAKWNISYISLPSSSCFLYSIENKLVWLIKCYPMDFPRLTKHEVPLSDMQLLAFTGGQQGVPCKNWPDYISEHDQPSRFLSNKLCRR